jgi:LysR family transcriptional regulator, carnitine catabolism transcriptional activator
MINVTPKQVKAFVAVSECRSFADACAVLHLSQPALSMAIKNLEQLVGGKLLIRTTRTLSLSPEGQAFLPVAKRLLADWDMAFNDLHNLFAKQRGKLAIAAMPSFAATKLAQVLAGFHQRYPNINVLVDDVVAEQVNDRVGSGRAELGITFKPDDLTDLDFVPLFRDRFVAVLPSNHPLASEQSLTLETITQYPLLLLQQPSSIRGMIEKALEDNNLKANIEMEAHQLATLGTLVAAGLGISIVPTLYTEPMVALGAVCRPLTNPIIEREVGVIVRKNSPLSAVAQAMIEALIELTADRQ